MTTKRSFAKGVTVMVAEIAWIQAVVRQYHARFTTAIDANSISDCIHTPPPYDTDLCGVWRPLQRQPRHSPVLPPFRVAQVPSPLTASASNDVHRGFLYLMDLKINDLLALAYNLCYRDAIVRRS